MDAVTYSNKVVIDFISQNTIPLRVAPDHKPMSTDFNIKWTPSLLILDKEGNEHHRTVGFMSTKELIPSILLGTGNKHFNNNRFTEALKAYEIILADFPESDSAPEAVFQKGVCLYKSANAPLPLKEAYEHLRDKYPTSQWAKRAYPYRLIQ